MLLSQHYDSLKRDDGDRFTCPLDYNVIDKAISNSRSQLLDVSVHIQNCHVIFTLKCALIYTLPLPPANSSLRRITIDT